MEPDPWQCPYCGLWEHIRNRHCSYCNTLRPGVEPERRHTANASWFAHTLADVQIESPKAIQDAIQKVMERERERLEQFAAAFLKEVGSAEATNWELVRDINGTKVSWFWRRRDTLPSEHRRYVQAQEFHCPGCGCGEASPHARDCSVAGRKVYCPGCGTDDLGEFGSQGGHPEGCWFRAIVRKGGFYI